MNNDAIFYENILPNLNANKIDINGTFYTWEISTVSDEYVIHDPTCDFNGPGPDGNLVYEPYYTYGPIMLPIEDYDWDTNPRGIEAVLRSTIPPDVMIFGVTNPEPPHETV